MIQKKSDDAVSPVIGIMLLVVVTVVIAAVITAFATGMVGSTEPVPVAALDVEIYSNQENMYGLSGPELFISHISGDAVDTDDIELRFSWTHKTREGEECSHSSTFTAEGFKNSGTSLENRNQPLYVKSTMLVDPERDEYGSNGINHYFGDVILTPGLRLSASSEFLNLNVERHTQSRFMDVVFDNYKITTKVTKAYGYRAESWWENQVNNVQVMAHASSETLQEQFPGDACFTGQGTCMYKIYYDYVAQGYCGICKHPISLCNEENDPYHECKCVTEDPWDGVPVYTGGIMSHLTPGTAVDVMIIHIPSNKAIYDKTVIVQ
ncbi:MAG: type IV pilin [Methanocorpusculum parvum]|nr:type IV pilin [Methanocorpusculum parvum]